MILEKRKYQRHKISVPLSCRPATKNLWPSWVLTKDVSQNGVRFQTNTHLEKGTKLKIEIEIPGRLFLIKGVGHIKWIKNNTDPDKTHSTAKKEVGMLIIFSEPLDAEIWKRYIQQSPMVANLSH